MAVNLDSIEKSAIFALDFFRLRNLRYVDYEALFDQAFRALVRENGTFYETLYDLYSPSVMRLLKAIAREGIVKEINASAFISKYNLKAASSVSSALKTLTETDQVCKTPAGYRLYDPLLAAWLRSM